MKWQTVCSMWVIKLTAHSNEKKCVIKRHVRNCNGDDGGDAATSLARDEILFPPTELVFSFFNLHFVRLSAAVRCTGGMCVCAHTSRADFAMRRADRETPYLVSIGRQI